MKKYKLEAVNRLLETTEFAKFIQNFSSICIHTSMILETFAGKMSVLSWICAIYSATEIIGLSCFMAENCLNLFEIYQKLERLYKKQALLVLKLREIAAILERFLTDFRPK